MPCSPSPAGSTRPWAARRSMQFRFIDPNKEVSPQIDFDGFDPDDPAGHRRGVYRFLVRNVSDPLLEAFDVPDPSLSSAGGTSR